MYMVFRNQRAVKLCLLKTDFLYYYLTIFTVSQVFSVESWHFANAVTTTARWTHIFNFEPLFHAFKMASVKADHAKTGNSFYTQCTNVAMILRLAIWTRFSVHWWLAKCTFSDVQKLFCIFLIIQGTIWYKLPNFVASDKKFPPVQ